MHTMISDSLRLNKALTFEDSKLSIEANEIAANASNRIELISNEEDFLALREQWNTLNDSSLNGTIFVSWEWLYTWWEVYQKQGKRSLYILTCTSAENELLGIAPFQIINNIAKYFPCNRQLALLGTGETDGSLVFGEYMDLVLKQGHETTVIDSFSRYLNQHKKQWDGLKFQQQLKGSHLAKLFQEGVSDLSDLSEEHALGSAEVIGKVIEDGFRTYIELPNSYKDYLMSLRKKMRNNITRSYSRLASEQNFSIDLVTSESEKKAETAGKDSAIDVLAKLNLTRRNDMDKASVFAQANFVSFHQRLVKRLLPLNKVALRILHIDEDPVAALYSFIDRDTVHAYQSGFETETGHRYSLLTTMLTNEIAESIKNPKVSRFNFMYSGDELSYKKRYSGTTEKMYNISYDKTGAKHLAYKFIHGPVKKQVKTLLKMS